MSFSNPFNRTLAGDERLGPSVGWWLSGVVALLAVVLVVLHVGEFGRFAELARTVHPALLLAAAALQALTYICAAAVWYASLRHLGAPRPLRVLIPLGIAKLFTDQALPSGGISGTMLVISGLKRRGVPGPLAMAALLVGLVSFYAAYGLVALTALGILQFRHHLGPAALSIAALFVLFAVGVPAMVFGLRRFREHRWLRRIRRIPGAQALLEALASAPSAPLRDAWLILEATALQLAVFVLDAATFYVMLLALGQSASPLAAFSSFIAADVVATIGPTPLGLGVFEGTAVAVLHITGVSLEAALSATLLLRGFTFWLPMLPGLWLVRRELTH